MNHTLDACAMLAYLQSESGYQVVKALLDSPTENCYAHVINLIEVYYNFLRLADEQTAENAINDLIADGVVVCYDMDADFWKRVAKLKGRGRISIADCFCIALAQRLGGAVVTTDHHEFDALVPLNIVPINFIR